MVAHKRQSSRARTSPQKIDAKVTLMPPGSWPANSWLRLAAELESILTTKDGKVRIAVQYATPQRMVILKVGPKWCSVQTRHRGRPRGATRGTPVRVDHALGYLLTRAIMPELRELRLKLRHRDARWDSLVQTNRIAMRLHRANLDLEMKQAAHADSAVEKNVLLTIAAHLVRFENPSAGTLGPLPSVSTIVRQKSLRGTYDRMFGHRSGSNPKKRSRVP